MNTWKKMTTTLMTAALLLAGCGAKSSQETSIATAQTYPASLQMTVAETPAIVQNTESRPVQKPSAQTRRETQADPDKLNAVLDQLAAGGTQNANNLFPETTEAETAPAETAADSRKDIPEELQEIMNTVLGSCVLLEVSDQTFVIRLEENSSAQALADVLQDAPLSLYMADYNSMEKVGQLPWYLPTNDEELSVGPCDVILYQGNQLCIYYGSNNWNFTRLGRIEGSSAEELQAALGTGSVTVTLSVPSDEAEEARKQEEADRQLPIS